MIEKRRKVVDAGDPARTLLTDLSKAFDCINHMLLTAKLNACGLVSRSSYFLFSYLDNRKQRTKVRR